jgi:RNA polymerase sigma factor FliA
VSRSVRRRSAEIEKTIVNLRNELGRLPTDEEVAERLKMDIDAYREILSQANVIFLSLDSPFSAIEGEGEMVLGEALEDTHMREIMAEIEEQDLHRELVNAIQELPEREQIILALYYYEELTVREVAEVMNLSPSRISQIMARSLMLLRARLMYDLAPSESRRRPATFSDEVGPRGPSRDTMYADSRYGVYERGAI